jgi:hypothetical protein
LSCWSALHRARRSPSLPLSCQHADCWLFPPLLLLWRWRLWCGPWRGCRCTTISMRSKRIDLRPRSTRPSLLRSLASSVTSHRALGQWSASVNNSAEDSWRAPLGAFRASESAPAAIQRTQGAPRRQDQTHMVIHEPRLSLCAPSINLDQCPKRCQN